MLSIHRKQAELDIDRASKCVTIISSTNNRYSQYSSLRIHAVVTSTKHKYASTRATDSQYFSQYIYRDVYISQCVSGVA